MCKSIYDRSEGGEAANGILTGYKKVLDKNTVSHTALQNEAIQAARQC